MLLVCVIKCTEFVESERSLSALLRPVGALPALAVMVAPDNVQLVSKSLERRMLFVAAGSTRIPRGRWLAGS
jgi:hypothetical protein